MIPRKVKKIVGADDYLGAFQNCEDLWSVTFEKGSELTEIGNNAFYECRNLKSIYLPDKLREIGKWAFQGCNLLKEVKIVDTC